MRLFLVHAFLATLIGTPVVATAQPPDVSIERPWARASIGTSRPAAAYLTIVNDSSAAVRLVGVATPVAGRAEVHRTVEKDGVMRMKPEDEVDVPGNGTITFEPGGLHVMLMDLQQALVRGEAFPLELRFADGRTRKVTVPVLGPGARGPDR